MKILAKSVVGTQALIAHLSFADLALLFCAHYSAEGRTAFDDT